jgi:hypothetical protein
MNLKIKITPYSMVKSNKPSAHDLFRSSIHFGSSSNGVQWGYWDDYGNVIGFHYQKINRKVKTSKRVKKEWNGQTVWTNKRTYEPKKWVVSYYKIPMTVLIFMGLSLKQKTNHFELVKSK